MNLIGIGGSPCKETRESQGDLRGREPRPVHHGHAAHLLQGDIREADWKQWTRAAGEDSDDAGSGVVKGDRGEIKIASGCNDRQRICEAFAVVK